MVTPALALSAFKLDDGSIPAHACCAGVATRDESTSTPYESAPLPADNQSEHGCSHCRLVASVSAVPASQAPVALEPSDWVWLSLALPLPFEPILPAAAPIGVHDDIGPPGRLATALVALHCQLTC